MIGLPLPDVETEPLSLTEAGGFELALLGVAVVLTLVIAGVFAFILLRGDRRGGGDDPSGSARS